MSKQIKAAVIAICQAQRIALASHVNPDGDALGSVLALAHVLRRLGKDVVVLLADGVPEIYRWLPGTEWVQTATDRRDFDLSIVCDAGCLERIGRSLMPAITSAPSIMDIDHHVADGTFGDIQVLDSGAAATAELIWRVVRALSTASGFDLASREVAECLMTGVITDTGSFRFMNVTPATFQLAARLQRLGAMPAVISELVFETRSLASVKLLGRALHTLQTTPDRCVAWTHLTVQDFEEEKGSDADTEGIVNHVRAIQGVLVGILFREVPGGRKVRISFRARDGADVNRIAGVFGGGGHKLAAGCSIEPPLDEVERRVIAETVRQLKADGLC